MDSSWLRRLLSGSNPPISTELSSENDDNTGTTIQQIDSFLASSMAQLNVHQRESVLEDLHGIRNSDNPESNVASVNLWLQFLDMHLQTIKRGTAYEVAEAMDRSHLSNKKFRMMFLRASRYDPHVAAVKIIKFLDLKRLLFGQEKLTKKITLADLNDDQRDSLASGSNQISTKRDRSGRGIVLMFPSLRGETTYETEMRARYYVLMSYLDDCDQVKGVVVVYFGALPARHVSNTGALWDMPGLMAGIHCCFNDIAPFLLSSLAIFRLPTQIRPRVRVHYGSCNDCLHKLSSFGIPREAVISPDTGQPVIDDHLEWYQKKLDTELLSLVSEGSDAEMASVASTGRIVPRSIDVLFGPGSRKNEGNLQLRNLVLATLDKHNEARKGQKMLLVDGLIDEIKKNGGRFLKQNEQTKEWEEASHIESTRKIAHTFRNIRRPSRAKKKP